MDISFVVSLGRRKPENQFDFVQIGSSVVTFNGTRNNTNGIGTTSFTCKIEFLTNGSSSAHSVFGGVKITPCMRSKDSLSWIALRCVDSDCLNIRGHHEYHEIASFT